MANKELKNQNLSTDHDLLIQVNTKLERVIQDIKDLADNVGSRVTHLEDAKLDKVDAERLKAEADLIHVDHENRIRSLEMWRWGLGGALIILQFLAPMLLNYIGVFK